MTASQLNIEKIRSIFDEVMAEARNSEMMSGYDEQIGLAALTDAQRVFNNISPSSSSVAYRAKLIAALSNLRDTYHGPIGEYCDGRSSIGALLNRLIARWSSDDL